MRLHALGAPGAPALALAGVVALAAVTWGSALVATGSSAAALALFVLVCALLFYAPGRWLLRAVGLHPQRLDGILLAVLVGMLAALGLYWCCARLGLRELFWAWPLAGTALWARSERGRQPEPVRARWSHVALVLVVILASVPLALVPIYLGNLVPLPDGGMSFQALPDVVFHAGIARELRHSVPPEIPFLPGVPLEYHYGADLLTALLASVPGLGVSDVVVRFVPLLFVALVALAAFCLARSWLGSETGAAVFALLVFFGEDLSWLPGLWTGSKEAWVVQLFGVPSIVSLYLLNPMSPALAYLLAALNGMQRFDAGEAPRAWGAVTALLVTGVFVFKVFAAAQLLASLGLAAALHLLLHRERRPALLVIGASLLSLPLAVPMLLAGSGKMWVRLEAWPWVPAAVVHSGLQETALGAAAIAGYEGAPGLGPTAAFWGVALPAYLLGALGLRWLGLPEWLRELRRASAGRLGPLTAAIFVGLGPLIAMTWVITPLGYPSLQTYNEAVWFFAQSKYVGWIFAVAVLCRVLASQPAWLRAAGFALAIAAAVPSAVQYLAFQARSARPWLLNADQVAGLGDLQRLSEPGDVVIAEPPLAGAAVALTHCRARDLSIFTWVHVPPEEYEREVREEREFWEAWRRGRLRRDLAEREGARFVLTGSGPGPDELTPVAAHGAVRLYELDPG